MKKIISTVGTSLLRRVSLPKETWQLLYRPANQYEKFSDQLQPLLEELQTLSRDNECCAELATLKYYKKARHHLIATDTVASLLCANVIASRLKDAQVHVAQHLNLDTYKHFQKGILSLLKIVSSIVENTSKELIFNISGGFKGVIPYLSAVAQIFDAKLIYDFEGKENELIVIKPLPIEFDPVLVEFYYPYLKNPKKINDSKIFKGLVELSLVDNEKNLTPLGEIFLIATEKNFLSKSTLGHFMELKLYEYFVQRYFKNRIMFGLEVERIVHGLKLTKNDNSRIFTDIDIALLGKKEYIWVELKSANHLFKSTSSLKKQIVTRQLPYRDRVGKKLKKFILVFYAFEKEIDPSKREKLKNIAAVCKKKRVEFESYFFQFPVHTLSTTQLFQKALDSFSIKELRRL